MSATAPPRRRGIPPAGSVRCCTSVRSPAPASCPADRARCATPSARWISSPAGCGRSPPPIVPLAATVPLCAPSAGASLAPRALQLSFRAKWPPWVVTDHDGNPVFDGLGMLRLDADARYVPSVGSDAYRIVVRDAYLLAGKQLPVDVDGRTLMALRHQRQISPAARRPVRSDDQREVAELAHRTGQPLGVLTRLAPAYRQAWLAGLRAQEAQRAQQDVLAFKARLARIPDEGGQ